MNLWAQLQQTMEAQIFMVQACKQSPGHDRPHLTDGDRQMIPRYAFHTTFMGPRQMKVMELGCMATRKGSLHQFIGPEPACGISERVARHAIRQRAENIRNTCSPLKDKDTQRALFFSPLSKGLSGT
jgi:hypothetical protein